MAQPTNKEDYYNKVKVLLEKNKFVVNPYRDIQYGLQFIVFFNNESGVIRIFESKKGLRIDLSQVKEEILKQKIENFLKPLELESGKLLPFSGTTITESSSKKIIKATFGENKKDPEELIGIDESGKGDYFGPLVVAAVYVDKITGPVLEGLGVKDSKVLNDTKITELSDKIKELCPHSLVIMSNKSYNELYEKMDNLNLILAWGHARVLENTLDQVDCLYALSDQFANPQLVKTALFSKGKQVNLIQRPKAESNIAVAAASILARAAFVFQIQQLEKQFKLDIPKGCSDKTVTAAKKLVESYGSDILNFAAKLHFKVTKEIIPS